MKKTGIIRCRQTEDMCAGNGCFKAAKCGIALADKQLCNNGTVEELYEVVYEVVNFVK